VAVPGPYFHRQKMLSDTIEHLRAGSRLQAYAYDCLVESDIFSRLAAYSPILCGTIPLDIALSTSDLDIICEVHDFEEFGQLICQHFSEFPHFQIQPPKPQSPGVCLASFMAAGLPVEIFGQNKPVHEQHAYRHMVQEYRVLQLADEPFRQKIICLKEKGYHTEAAFAHLLKLEGNPFMSILSLEQMSEATIKSMISAAGTHLC
jgi:hypothetical protein